MTTHDVSSDSQTDEILNQNQSILDQRQIGWTATRPFMRQLGVGGQGVVYLSVRQGADNFSLPVALKIFSPKCYDDAETYEQEMCRIAQVASRVARIQHDNLIDVQTSCPCEGAMTRDLLGRKSTTKLFMYRRYTRCIPSPSSRILKEHRKTSGVVSC